MNDLLHLKGSFDQARNESGGGAPVIPAGACVSAAHIDCIVDSLQSAKAYWDGRTMIDKVLINANYRQVVAKSNRIRVLLSTRDVKPNDAVVGARFTTEGKPKHIITYCVSSEALDTSIRELRRAAEIVRKEFQGFVKREDLLSIQGNNKTRVLSTTVMSPTRFAQIIKDTFYVESFAVQKEANVSSEESIITLYDVKENIADVLNKVGIDSATVTTDGNNTFLLNPDQIAKLKYSAPYLIAMATEDLTELTLEDCLDASSREGMSIPAPAGEPTIGVIDTFFDTSVYFADWVTPVRYVDHQLDVDPEDYIHGTQVSSIIVDGPASNPSLDDGCGRFRARHFEVAKAGRYSAFTIINSIKAIVESNPDIKVWNLSLGSPVEVHPNFMSYAGAVLDELQYENDVIFVVAGTNKPLSVAGERKIGAPADSLNSISVNSIDGDGNPSPFSRSGPVLSFFNKPDVSCFGGGNGSYIQVCSPTGAAYVAGTSYAAPWIARKIAFLIHVMGFSREIAKALIIDSAAGWRPQNHSAQLVGFGSVPIHIKDVIGSQNDEIKFVLSGKSEAYNTYTYNLPIPVVKGEHPYKAMATLCSFPKCNRNQGVDYTNTELNIRFGRMRNGEIKPIDNNTQGDAGIHLLYEEDVRKNFRKWDNTKHIGEVLTGRSRSVKSYGGLWGLSIKAASRLDSGDSKGLPFGVVIRLKELNGKNRIDSFVEQCMARGWLVERIDYDSRIAIFEKTDEDIEFEEDEIL